MLVVGALALEIFNNSKVMDMFQRIDISALVVPSKHSFRRWFFSTLSMCRGSSLLPSRTMESQGKNAEELQRGWSLYLMDLHTLSSNRMFFFGNYFSMISEWFPLISFNQTA